MKKNNNKGFLLVETLVVSTFCLTVLVLLFLQFRNLVISYNNSFRYNTVEGIYTLKNTIKKCIDKNIINVGNNDFLVINDTNSGACAPLITEGDFKTIIYTTQTITNFKSSVNNNTYGKGLKKFVNQLKDQNGQNRRLIAEFNNGTYASIVFTGTNSNEYHCPSDYPYSIGEGSSMKCYKTRTNANISCSGYSYNGQCYANKTQMTKCDIYSRAANAYCIIGVACGFNSPDNAKSSDYYTNNCLSVSSPKVCSTVYEKLGSVSSKPIGTLAGYCYSGTGVISGYICSSGILNEQYCYSDETNATN